MRPEVPLPATVCLAWHRWADAEPAALAPTERAGLSPHAVVKRQQEYSAGRLAARAALARLGLDPPPPVRRGPDRAPGWPPGVVGAITHADGLALAAVAWRRDHGGLGIDLEHAGGVRRMAIADRVADPAERAWIQHGPDPRRRLAALFSAKEAVYKALYPRVGRYFGFGAVSGRFDAAAGAFDFTLCEPLGPGYAVGALVRVPVRWQGERVLTTLCLPPDPPEVP